LTVHPDGDPADAGPGVEPGAESPERAVGGHRAPGESDGRTEESATLVEHALLDHLVRPPQHRGRDGEAERLRGLEVDDQFELRGLLDRKVGGLGPS
jgi:hypothetical protein